VSEYRQVVSAIAPMTAEPSAGSTQVSQALAGHRLAVLEEQAPWLRVRSDDDYTGWVHEGYLAPTAATGSLGRRISLGCSVREAGNRRRDLPLRAYLPDDAVVEYGRFVTSAGLAGNFPRTAAGICARATTLFDGAPYQWGGVTPWGADCSGFTQAIFALHGVRLPRDSRDQAECGTEGGERIEGTTPADLLFFSDREDSRITHVAIALGESRLAHVALGRGGFAIEDTAHRERDPYVKALVGRFRFARHLL